MVQKEKRPNGAGKHDEQSTRCKSPEILILCRGQGKGWRDLSDQDASWFPPRHRKIPESAKVLQKSKDVNRSEIYQIKSDAGRTTCSTEETRQRKQPAQAYAGR